MTNNLGRCLDKKRTKKVPNLFIKEPLNIITFVNQPNDEDIGKNCKYIIKLNEIINIYYIILIKKFISITDFLG